MRPLPLLLLLGACAAPLPPIPPAPPSAQTAAYRAVGQEPGWTLTVERGMLHYLGDYGETRISVPAPAARPTFNGHRYETARLVVDITHGLCNDAMSGRAFADRVTITADGRTVQGCGGARLPAKDM